MSSSGSLRAQLIDQDDIESQQTNELAVLRSQEINQMSTLFNLSFDEAKMMAAMAIAADLLMGGLNWLTLSEGCSAGYDSDLIDWANQWGWYFVAKAIYHSIIYITMFSTSLKEEACEFAAEFRTQSEDNQHQAEYANLSIIARMKIRNAIDRKIAEFYYRRNCLLGTLFVTKLLSTLTYMIYGMIVFFSKDYFSVWLNRDGSAESNCDFYLSFWAYMSAVFVIACNKELFQVAIIIILSIPVILFVVLPYQVIKKYKQKRKLAKIFTGFPKQKYSTIQQKGETECAICKMDFEDVDVLTILPCNQQHYFHTDCIHGWLKINLNCPFCRFNFYHNDFQENVDRSATTAATNQSRQGNLNPVQNLGNLLRINAALPQNQQNPN